MQYQHDQEIGTVARLAATSHIAAHRSAIKLDFSISHDRNSVLILCIIVVAVFFVQGSSSIRKPCTHTSVCDIVLTVRKFIAHESLRTIEDEIFTRKRKFLRLQYFLNLCISQFTCFGTCSQIETGVDSKDDNKSQSRYRYCNRRHFCTRKIRTLTFANFLTLKCSYSQGDVTFTCICA